MKEKPIPENIILKLWSIKDKEILKVPGRKKKYTLKCKTLSLLLYSNNGQRNNILMC